MRLSYLPLADSVFIYDNSDASDVLIAERREGAPLTVHDIFRWKQIEQATQ